MTLTDIIAVGMVLAVAALFALLVIAPLTERLADEFDDNHKEKK